MVTKKKILDTLIQQLDESTISPEDRTRLMDAVKDALTRYGRNIRNDEPPPQVPRRMPYTDIEFLTEYQHFHGCAPPEGWMEGIRKELNAMMLRNKLFSEYSPDARIPQWDLVK